MEKKIDDVLEKVEPSRRDFMKKVAIGTAYAVPVIASFSLDSVKNKAFAQSTYGNAPEWEDQEPLLTAQGLRITFTQPMDKSVSPEGADVCYNRQVRFPDTAAVPYVAMWAWDGDQAQILTISGAFTDNPLGGAPPPAFFCGTIEYRFSDPANTGCINFKGQNGLDLLDSGWKSYKFPCDE